MFCAHLIRSIHPARTGKKKHSVFCQRCYCRIRPRIKVRVRISCSQTNVLICKVLCVCVCGCACNGRGKGTVGTAGLQLGRVFRARDQTAARSINTSQDRSHRRASLTTSAPLGALKTLPAPRMLLAWQSEGEELRGS